MASKRSAFTRFAAWTAHASGRPLTFLIAVLIVVIWAASGPVFKFGNTWQLVINTGTTIITFLMVFLIQNTQNRDGAAVQIKLDELIRAIKTSNNALLNLEELDGDVLDRMRAHYCRLAESARDNIEEMLDKYEKDGDGDDQKDRSGGHGKSGKK
ncbi:MAG: low affinity iron permease family protein [Rhodanobacteraceae bacterium]